jgi:COMPASS component BRE2
MGERFNDQIVEDVLADVVDEVEAMFTWGGIDGDVIGNNNPAGDGGLEEGSASGAVGGTEVLKGGVGAAIDSVSANTPGTAGASDSAANSNRETPIAADGVGGVAEDGVSVGTAGTPLAVEITGDGDRDGDGDVDMT